MVNKKQQYQDLSKFNVPKGFRGKSKFIVQIWWIIEKTLFAMSPQFFYGWRRFLLRSFGAKIGKNVILNTACIIEHECEISDSVHIAPGAVLAGNVFVGERSFIGANSVVMQGVKIGKDVIIGAGSVVISDVPDGKKIVGNPSRFI